MIRCARPATRLVAAIAVSAAALVSSARADVRLPNVLGSHMVVQRDVPLPVWGWAAPGEDVSVTFGDANASTKADAEGKWQVQLPAKQAGGPHKLSVVGRNKVELNDILVGEVWVCSGQSNMEWNVAISNNPEAEIAAANHPQIRLFHVPKRPSGTPQSDVTAEWKACTPKNIPTFSAVSYYFGRELNKELNVPIGLINTSWGGTRIEPWTPPAGFESVKDVSDIAQIQTQLAQMAETYKTAQTAAVEKVREWASMAEKNLAAGKAVPELPQLPKSPIESHVVPTGLYNGMVHGLLPFPVRGAIWYQGESNLADGALYHHKMKALINGWRTVWNNPEMPFLFVQLAPFRYSKDDPTKLPLLWEAQTETLNVPNTGMAVTTDISNILDIHPRNKQDVGKRLSLWALAKTYGRDGLVYSGPRYKSMKVEGETVRVEFDQPVASRDGLPLSWFTIAGEDKTFVPAVAEIDGNSVVVRSLKVGRPTAVRFAWHGEAEPNLANKEGLPAIPFRTDK
ncbi:MAG: sialate O-acetylesterase [Planctomycetaceae bacterium]